MSINGWKIRGLVEQNEGEWWFDLVDPSGQSVPSEQTGAQLTLTKDGAIHPTRVMVIQPSAKKAIDSIKHKVRNIVLERKQERKQREVDLARRALRYDVVLHE